MGLYFKKIRHFVVDGDGTTWFFPGGDIYGSSWYFVAKKCGVEKERKALMEKYLGKKGLNHQWAMEEALLYKGKKISKLDSGLMNLPYLPGIREFMNATKGRYERGLLSGGAQIVAERAAAELNLDWYLANPLKIENGLFTGEHIENVSIWNKHEILEKLFCNVSLDSVCYVGDSLGDKKCMERCSLSFAINPKDEETRKAADYVVKDYFEVMKIIGLNGYGGKE